MVEKKALSSETIPNTINSSDPTKKGARCRMPVDCRKPKEEAYGAKGTRPSIPETVDNDPVSMKEARYCPAVVFFS